MVDRKKPQKENSNYQQEEFFNNMMKALLSVKPKSIKSERKKTK